MSYHGRLHFVVLPATQLQCTFEEALAGAGGGNVPKRPDAYLAFNPGFTCPDYEWSETLEALNRYVGSGDTVFAGLRFHAALGLWELSAGWQAHFVFLKFINVRDQEPTHYG